MIRPLRDLLLIQPEKPPGMVGSLHVPDIGLSGNKSGCVCKVIAAGPDVQDAKVGTKVLVPAYGSHPAGDEVTIRGTLCTLIRERDIHGVLT